MSSLPRLLPPTIPLGLLLAAGMAGGPALAAPAQELGLFSEGPWRRGQNAVLELSAPGRSGSPYALALSLGTWQGISTPAGLIGLDLDELLLATLGGGPGLSGFSGVLDGAGRATARLAVPDNPALEGLELYAAAVLLDPAAPGGIGAISNSLARRVRSAAPTYDTTALDAALKAFSDAWPFNDGLALCFVQNGRVQHSVAFGDIGLTSRVPYASATKWISGLALMRLVDQGQVGLDSRLSEWLPTFGGPKATITFGQAFAHTSGLPAQAACIGDESSTLQACGAAIGLGPLPDAPGSLFKYGGVSMHAAGAAIEKIVGQGFEAWQAADLIAALGPSTYALDGFGSTLNPRIAGGGMGTLLDYAPVLALTLDGGALLGQPILSTDALRAQLAEQTGGAPIGSTPLPSAAGYGVGLWRERVGPAGEPRLVSSPGAFGAYPLVDFELGYGAFLLMRRTTGDALAVLAVIQPLLEALAREG
jgi:CubicO group peptidase (beta-lactamase class C family)